VVGDTDGLTPSLADLYWVLLIWCLMTASLSLGLVIDRIGLRTHNSESPLFSTCCKRTVPNCTREMQTSDAGGCGTAVRASRAAPPLLRKVRPACAMHRSSLLPFRVSVRPAHLDEAHSQYFPGSSTTASLRSTASARRGRPNGEQAWKIKEG
jgi:hypothetical protein